MNNGNYVVYAGLVVAALAHIGWVADTDSVTTIIAGIAALIGAIYQHYTTVQIAKGLPKS